MKKILLAVIMLCSLSLSYTASAQFRKIPAEVTNAFAAKYGAADNVEWRDNLSAFVAGFEQDGEKLEARFNKKGEWMSTEKMIAISDLPPEVNTGYEKSKYADWDIKHAFEIELPEDVKQYRVRVAKSELHQKNLLFNQEGRLLKDNLTL